MTSTREAMITLDEKLPTIRIERVFGAAPEQVFRAHTDPEIFVRWVGPDALEESRVDRWDCRTGGEWRYLSTHEGQEHWFHGSFHEVRPEDHTVIQTWTYEGFPDSVSLERLVVEDLGDGTCRLVATSLLESFEARDGMVASGMEVGVQEGYRSLDRLVAEGNI